MIAGMADLGNTLSGRFNDERAGDKPHRDIKSPPPQPKPVRRRKT